MRIQRIGMGIYPGGRAPGMGAFINGPGTATPVPPALDPTQSGSAAAPNTTTVLNNAKSALLAAGYTGAECHEETVYYPGGSYQQDICSAPGYTGGSDANLVALMSPAQLAAQRAYETASGEGTSATPDYFQMTAGAPNIAVGQSTAPSGGASATTANVAPDWFSTLQSQLNNVTKQVTGAAAPPATPISPPATGTGGSNSTNTAANDSTGGTLIPGVPDIALYIGGALALFLLLKGGK